MTAIDREALREKARLAAETGRAKAEEARRLIEQKKALKANPVPQYVEMPDGVGDAEADAQKDLGELESGFRRRAADESRRFALVTDTEYWGAICFETREQRDAFFAALGVAGFGNRGRYFDGNAIADKLGIALPASELSGTLKVKDPDQTWVRFTDDES